MTGATVASSSDPADMTGVIVGSVLGAVFLLLVGTAFTWQYCKARSGEDVSKVDESEFHPVAASPTRQITGGHANPMPR